MLYKTMLEQRIGAMKLYLENGNIPELKNAVENFDIALLPKPELKQKYVDYMISCKDTLDKEVKELDKEDPEMFNHFKLHSEIKYYYNILVFLEKLLT